VKAGVRDKGVTAMHDATECGVWGGLFEVAQASGVGMIIDKENIIVQQTVKKICELFEIDPFSSISEGTLIITCRPEKSCEVLQRLTDKGIPASLVGEIVEASEGMHYSEKGKMYPLRHPKIDPFWLAFGKAASKRK
jgi:hydrogenase expression/formation protein HypE